MILAKCVGLAQLRCQMPVALLFMTPLLGIQAKINATYT